MEDTTILQLLWQRAERALSALAEKYGKGLHRLAMNILNSRQDAEETVNDTYLSLWNAIPPAKPDPLSGYVYRVGRNTALKRLRENTALKRCSRYDVSLDELAGTLSGNTLEEEYDAVLLGQCIDRFLDTLSRQNRRIFLRRYWFGDSIEALAREESLSPNSLSVRLHRLRRQLKDYLIKEGFTL